MELSGELLHYLRTGGKILFVLLLLPLGAYLREQTYRSTRGNATIGRDLETLFGRLRKWRQTRNLKRKNDGKER